MLENYGEINLLRTTLKLPIKILTNKISERILLAHEQRGFRSCTDAFFVIRQVTENS